MAIGEQVEKLRRLAERSVDKHKKQLLLELVSHAQELENEYVMETGDPMEAALLSMLLYVYASCKECSKRPVANHSDAD
jgi:hypothetical protein